VKLRRFHVVLSQQEPLSALASACARGLEDAGLERSDSAPDVVLDFGDERSHHAPTTASPFGVWRFVVDGGEPIGWRAMIEGRRSVRARLCADLPNGRRVVLLEGVLPIVSLSYRKTRSSLEQWLSSWPARAAAEAAHGIDRFNDGGRESADDTPPSLMARLRWPLVQPWRTLARWWRESSRYDTWNVGVARLPAPLRDVRDLATLRHVQWLPEQPPLFYVADPFPYDHDGRRWLLVESYGHPKGIRGRIARIDPRDRREGQRPAIAIARGATHLSCPSVFRDEGGRVCCAPEMQQERDGCVLYRLEADGSWQPFDHILRGRDVVDPAVFRHGDRWWVFCGNAQAAGSLALDAYFAPALAGPWTPHPLNPLKMDLSSARPAGRPFTIDGRLYRPAMDCSRTYGGAVQIMEVVDLTATRFRERLAARIDPDPASPYPDGLHHLVVDGDEVYIDAKRQRYDNWLWLKNWWRGCHQP